MHLEALEKVLNIGRKKPKILLSPSFFEKISARLDISTSEASNRIRFRHRERQAKAVIITAENCQEYKCVVNEGQSGIRIFEFIKALVELLTNETIPPSPHEKMGPTAEYYCEKGIAILEGKFLR